jgi:glycosyltransferase involved in cell wall biosynthesis
MTIDSSMTKAPHQSRTPKVLFLVPYPLHRAPSQRFRVELFLPVLEKTGITYHIQTFLDEKTWDVLYKKGSALQKGWGVIKGYARRLKAVLVEVPRYDYVFIHREAAPLGPPLFEWIIAKLWRKKIIYDFDDAIWIPNTSRENKLVGWFKAFWKIKYICSWAHKVVGGNDYLCTYARQYNNNVVLIPTCVDVERRHNRVKDQHTTDTVVIGWTGSHSTMTFLEPLVPVLGELVQQHRIEVVIISNKEPSFSFHGLRYLPWSEATEIEDLLQLHIGIMPLEADPWCEGKCGFKLVQYLALGIPAVASPVGVNQSIVEEDVNGYLCSTSEDWKEALQSLIGDARKRMAMGAAGHRKIVEHYSIQAHAGRFTGLFN